MILLIAGYTICLQPAIRVDLQTHFSGAHAVKTKDVQFCTPTNQRIFPQLRRMHWGSLYDTRAKKNGPS